MASYLEQCTGVCGSLVRSMTPFTGPVLCDSCRPRVKAEEARVQRENEAGAALEAAKAEKAAKATADARDADKKRRAEAAAKAEAPVAVKEPPKRPGRFSRK